MAKDRRPIKGEMRRSRRDQESGGGRRRSQEQDRSEDRRYRDDSIDTDEEA